MAGDRRQAVAPALGRQRRSVARVIDEWRARAACRGVEPEKYFPQNRPSRDSLSPCRDCPVREQCLEFALSSPWKPEGIWAGLTTPEIQAAWRRRHPRQSHAEALVLLGLK